MDAFIHCTHALHFIIHVEPEYALIVHEVAVDQSGVHPDGIAMDQARRQAN